ncbi:hypothetical protein [Myxococcus landrumensis]|uniref:Uncharacterized protein n=1 Tax=Myxococcus landrumensis TaxID=2813577 RepID=A0ABX7NFW3_9BACT|nr:hypothetical protein [Myxococcus landrumus]QSQ17726.1 hypothetical protein JY572_17560 [Myxococcus landrumus]
MSDSETPSARLLDIFQANDLPFDSAEAAWARAEHLFPLLGWVVAHFPNPLAFQTCAEWLSLCAARIEDARPAAELFAQARSTVHLRQAHIVAGGLGDLRNQWILEKKPAAAAFADSASDLAETWAAITTGEADGETEAWARAKAATRAMVTAWVVHQGLDSEDPAQRRQAQVSLVGLLRDARAKSGLKET